MYMIIGSYSQDIQNLKTFKLQITSCLVLCALAFEKKKWHSFSSFSGIQNHREHAYSIILKNLSKLKIRYFEAKEMRLFHIVSQYN